MTPRERPYGITEDPASYFFAVGTYLFLKSILADSGTIFPAAVFYSIESAVIGIVAVLKMRRAKKPNPPGKNGLTPNSMMFLLCVMLIPQGMFLLFFGHIGGKDLVSNIATPGILLVAFGCMLARHVVEYIEFRWRGDFERIAPVDVQEWVFARLMVFHISLVIGLVFLGSFTATLYTFIIFKILVEFLMFLTKPT